MINVMEIKIAHFVFALFPDGFDFLILIKIIAIIKKQMPEILYGVIASSKQIIPYSMGIITEKALIRLVRDKGPRQSALYPQYIEIQREAP